MNTHTCAHCNKGLFEAAPGLWRDEDGFTICWPITSRLRRKPANPDSQWDQYRTLVMHEPVPLLILDRSAEVSA